MFLLSHPTGNTFVRAALQTLDENHLLHAYYTTLALTDKDWPARFLPAAYRREMNRRAYQINPERMVRFPQREIVRQVASKLNVGKLTAHETGWASVDAVYAHLDRMVAQALSQTARSSSVSGVYCYEDCAWRTFQAAGPRGIAKIYDLPIAYWRASRQLQQEETERLPEWRETMTGMQDSDAKLARKTEELEMADVVITPSLFVYRSLPAPIRAQKKCCVVEFGSPSTARSPEKTGASAPEEMRAFAESEKRSEPSAAQASPLRVLFAGSMTQRKGLGDLFMAMKLLNRSDVELVVLGSPVAPLAFYRRQYGAFRHEATRPHAEVLRLMQSCDVFVLPSLVEGRALVQQEAMACGLPLIITPNTGGEDLIVEGETGFLVPIRSPEAIAAKIAWFADHRKEVSEMGEAARRKAAEYTWERYRQKLAAILCNAPESCVAV